MFCQLSNTFPPWQMYETWSDHFGPTQRWLKNKQASDPRQLFESVQKEKERANEKQEVSSMVSKASLSVSFVAHKRIHGTGLQLNQTSQYKEGKVLAHTVVGPALF